MDFSSHASLLGSHRTNNSEDSSIHLTQPSTSANIGTAGVSSIPGPSINVFPYRDPDFVLNGRAGRVSSSTSEGWFYGMKLI